MQFPRGVGYLFIVGVAIGLSLALLTHPIKTSKAIPSWRYEAIFVFANRYPEIRPVVRDAIDDGVISEDEEAAIMKVLEPIQERERSKLDNELAEIQRKRIERLVK